jgi:hypoxanthine-guanine phosphoribosyltransferase
LQDKNPLVVALLPDSAVMLGTLMQRTVFAQQVVFAEFSASGLCQIGDWPSLNARTVVLLDGGRLSAGDYQQVAQELGKHALTAIWLCRLLGTTTDDLPDGCDKSLHALNCDAQNVFGCGLDVLGYCRNLPGLYAYD